MKRVPQLAALALLIFLFATNVYRAATQSITGDEALTYNTFVWPQIADTFNSYNANNHVLHTLLCKLSVRTFGLSEFGLRVPSLAGGLLFLVSVWRLASYVFGRGWFGFCAFAAVVLNPEVLDFLSAARGYGLAMGFLFWGLFLLTRYLAEDYDPPRGALYRAGLACGLAIASNLVFLVPALAAGAVFSLLFFLSGPRAGFGSRFWEVVDRFWGPALVSASLFVAVPLTHAGREHFYYGARTLAEAVLNLVSVSLTHKPDVWRLGRYLPRFNDWVPAAAHVVVPLLAALVALAAIALARRWARSRDLRALGTRERATLLVAGTIALSFTVLLAANLRLGVLYPLGRTGLYWLPLFTLGVALATAWLWRAGPGGKAAASLVGTLAVAAVGLFIAGFTWDQYPEWLYDAGTRRVVDVLRRLPRPAPPARLRLGIDWRLEPSLNFYRHKYHLDWIEPVTRDGPDAAYDAYVLLPRDEGLIAKRGLRPVYRDPVSEATLAVPAATAAPEPSPR